VAKGQRGNLIEQLRAVMLPPGETDLSDGQLLECLVSRRDEAAAGALVGRHGPMVWGVCRRVLRNHHDAEDAFQATFLVLVRRAASIQPRELVANWLYGVARQTALKARAAAAKRLAREKQLDELPAAEAAPEADPGGERQALLDRELSRLTDKYRIAIILCDLEGRSRKEVARRLRIPEGTLSSRLTTARALLARRLARHGFQASAGALAAVLAQQAASATVPSQVLTATIEATSLAASGNAAVGAMSARVAALTEGVLQAMLLSKLKVATFVLLAVSAVAVGSAALTYRLGASEPGGAATTRAGNTETPSGSAPGVKAEGGERPPGQKAPEGPAGEGPKVRALLKERLETLRKIADRVQQLYQEKVASPELVRQANLRVYKAELDLCDTTKERIAVLVKILQVYKDMEDHANELVTQGVASQHTVLEARVNRLEAEIALEREKAKLAPTPR
jgi:RNA polymerase sigma factor (sigma-70 family)